MSFSGQLQCTHRKLQYPNTHSYSSSPQTLSHLVADNCSVMYPAQIASRYLPLNAASNLVENSQRSLNSWCPSGHCHCHCQLQVLNSRGVKIRQYPGRKKFSGSTMLRGQQVHCQVEWLSNAKDCQCVVDFFEAVSSGFFSFLF